MRYELHPTEADNQSTTNDIQTELARDNYWVNELPACRPSAYIIHQQARL